MVKKEKGDVLPEKVDSTQKNRVPGESVLQMVDLFSGAGGLSIGLERAGFHAIAAVEINRDACHTYATLFPGVDLRDTDIRALDFRYLRGHVDLVAGGPPCQPFSSGGKRLAHDDERNMVPEFLRVVQEIDPPVVLMENVPGLASGERTSYLQSVVDHLRLELGYEVTWEILNAAHYGVPQKRRRLFVVGSKIGKFVFPARTHGPGTNRALEKAGNYLSKTTVYGSPNTSRVVYAKQPDLRPSPYDGHLFNGGGRAIDLSAPCHTVLASAGGNKTHFVDTLDEVPRYHKELLDGRPPRQGALLGGRRLTIQESARIQTFPDEIQFFGSNSSQYSQVGNAVPPLVAEGLGIALTALLTRTQGEAVGL